MSGSLVNFAPDGADSRFSMTRAGVGYVAMVAAGVSAGALGYAVIWSYEPEALPPVTMAAPPGLPVVRLPPLPSVETPPQQPATPPIAAAPAPGASARSP